MHSFLIFFQFVLIFVEFFKFLFYSIWLSYFSNLISLANQKKEVKFYH